MGRTVASQPLQQQNDGRRRQDHEADLERGAEPLERKKQRADQRHDRGRNQEEPLSNAPWFLLVPAAVETKRNH